MLSWKACAIGVVVLLISSSLADSSFVDEPDEDDFEDEDFFSAPAADVVGDEHRGLAAAAKPLWFDRIKAEDTTGLLRACAKKQPFGPVEGQRCGRREKICMFGTQSCANIGTHPEKSCYCDGVGGTRKWTCTEQTCPVVEEDPDTCPPQNADDPSCPADLPEFDKICKSLPASGKTVPSPWLCDYGNENCCGICVTENTCTCFPEQGIQFCSQQRPVCDLLFEGAQAACKRHKFRLGGQTCEEATAAILKVFPPVTVVCENESADPKIVNDDENRFIVYTDDTSGSVTNVFFNRKAECAADKSCEFAGQKCDYESRNGSCYTQETCICVGSETKGFSMSCDRNVICS